MRWVALVLVLANLGLAGWIAIGSPGARADRKDPPPELGELKLLREAPVADPTQTARRQNQGTTCYTIGPFDTAKQAKKAKSRLSELGVEPSQRTTEDEEVYGYQVLLPARPSREAAIETTRRLADKGIEDYFVIVENPDLRNAISVGLFQEKRYAVQHTQYLEELGFDPRMRVRTRTRTRYWQDYRDPEGKVTEKILQALEAEQALQRLERPCES